MRTETVILIQIKQLIKIKRETFMEFKINAKRENYRVRFLL